MRLVILGSGTCVPSGARCSSGYWVEAGAARVRLDCGAGTVHAMARWGLPWEALTHQFISHFHIDHVGELPALLFTFKCGLRTGRTGPRTQPLVLCGPAGLRQLIERQSEAYRERLLDQEFPVTIEELVAGDTLAIVPGAWLRVCKTPHTTESLAVRIEGDGRALGYTGDTAPSPELADFFADVDVLVAECSFLDDARRTAHLLADDVAALAAAARVRHLVATHCYFDPEAARLAERLARRYSGSITIARDGLAVDC